MTIVHVAQPHFVVELHAALRPFVEEYKRKTGMPLSSVMQAAFLHFFFDNIVGGVDRRWLEMSRDLDYFKLAPADIVLRVMDLKIEEDEALLVSMEQSGDNKLTFGELQRLRIAHRKEAREEWEAELAEQEDPLGYVRKLIIARSMTPLGHNEGIAVGPSIPLQFVDEDSEEATSE